MPNNDSGNFSNKPDTNKVGIYDSGSKGLGLYAKESIKKGEFICGVYGKRYFAISSLSLPLFARDYALPIGTSEYQMPTHPNSLWNFLNHSCTPNTGIKNVRELIAIKDISKGEIITLHYALIEDSDWKFPGGICLCGSQNCIGDQIPAYRYLSKENRKKYKEWTSSWILKKYNIE